jgi:hypothetical protein
MKLPILSVSTTIEEMSEVSKGLSIEFDANPNFWFTEKTFLSIDHH